MIFYEKEYAEILLESGFTSFMNFEELTILAKYFRYEGKNNSQIRESLINFCKKFCPDFNEVLSRGKIDDAIKKSQKYGIRLDTKINITHAEIEEIKSFGNYKKQKILFVMLVLAKYFKYNNTKLNKDKEKYDNDFFVFLYNFITILKLAKVNIGKIERKDILHEFEERGMITTSRYDVFKVNFVCEDSPIEIIVDNLEDIISFYPGYCEKCGRVIKNRAKKHDLCEECYNEHRRNDIKLNVRKYRKNR